tara:strand:- start:182 stop:559 length:378 start_codon:yes stop_codon:yes gene_type:complete
MKDKLKYILILCLSVGVLTYLYISNPSTNYYDVPVKHSFENSKQFVNVQDKFVSQVVSVKGIVTDVTLSSPYISVILDGTLCFSFESEKTQENIQLTDTLSIKGRYEGYDELFEEYSFTDCSVYN